jgi:transcriptional regulator with XRE-family HTH domain
MAASTGPAVRRRQLMTELKRLRESAGLTQEDVAGQLDWHPTKIMRIETGRTAPHPNDVRVMLGLYGVADSGVLAGLLKLAKDARQRGWWYSYKDVLLSRFELFLGLESEADSIRDFELSMIPGLLQTDDYARELIRGLMAFDAAEIERRVELRMARQQILDREDAPHLWAILDEAAVHRVVGGKAIMKAQLLHLANSAEHGRTTIQVLPFSAGPHPGQAGPFIILGFAEPTEPEVVYMETVGGNLYVDKSEEVRLFSTVFDQLRAVALSPSQSAAMLQALAGELG